MNTELAKVASAGVGSDLASRNRKHMRFADYQWQAALATVGSARQFRNFEWVALTPKVASSAGQINKYRLGEFLL